MASAGSHRRQRGMALITVMLVLALAVVIATEMTSRLNWSMRRADNWQTRQQGFWYALGAEALARQALIDDIGKDPDRTHLGQNWAQPVPLLPVDDVLIGGQMRDLHACFNLNVLAQPAPENADFGWEPAERADLQRLLEMLGMDNYDAEGLSYRLLDWVDPGQDIASSLGAEDSEYASQAYPYLTPDAPLVNLSEIRPVTGINRDTFELIKDTLCVRPADTTLAININTLPPEQAKVLAAVLGNNLTETALQEVLEQRPEEGYEKVNDFLGDPVFADLKNKQVLATKLTVSSQWFELTARVEQERGQFGLTSVMKRTADDTIVVVSRRYGGAW